MISTARVQRLLGITPNADPEVDAYIGTLIAEATAALGRELHDWYGDVTTFTDVLDVCACQGRYRVGLPRRPLSVSLVESRQTPFSPWRVEAGGTYTAVGYDLLSEYGFPSGFGTLRVTYTAGFAVDTGPAELRGIIEQAVLQRYRASTRTDGDTQSESLGDYSYTRFGADDLAKVSGWADAVRRWRRLWV